MSYALIAYALALGCLGGYAFHLNRERRKLQVALARIRPPSPDNPTGERPSAASGIEDRTGKQGSRNGG